MVNTNYDVYLARNVSDLYLSNIREELKVYPIKKPENNLSEKNPHPREQGKGEFLDILA